MTTGTMTVQSGTRCLTQAPFPSFRSARIDQQPANGRLDLLPDGYAYAANPGFVGNDVFRITWWNSTDAYRRGVDILATVTAPAPAIAPAVAPATGPARSPTGTTRPASVAQQPPASSPPDAEARLRQLQRLRDQGLITEDEYRTRRQRILDAL